jgi:hypothetical protein
MTVRRAHKRYGVSPEKFVQEWQKSSSLEDAAARLGMPKANVSSRAASYRKMGAQLKKFATRRSPTIDVALLNDIISSDGKG